METVPGATPVTTPVAVTVASAVLDDVHVDVAVTSCAVPSDMVAIALNCDDPPMAGVAPVTATELTVDGFVVEFPHARVNTTSGADRAIDITRRICIRPPRIVSLLFQPAHSEVGPRSCGRSAARLRNNGDATAGVAVVRVTVS